MTGSTKINNGNTNGFDVSSSSYIDVNQVYKSKIKNTNHLDDYFTAKTARLNCDDYFSNHEVARKIISQIQEKSMSGYYSLTYDYNDDMMEGIWDSNIINYLELLGFSVENTYSSDAGTNFKCDNKIIISWC